MLFGCFYARFLTAIKIRAPTMAIAMMMATPTPTTYISVGGKVKVGGGDAVGAAAFTTNAVCACDGQYE